MAKMSLSDARGDELEQLLADVHRIADGLGGLHELAISLAPNTPPAAAAARLRLTPGDVARMRAIEDGAARAQQLDVTVPVWWIRALLAVVDDRSWRV